ncbi:MAG: hypothetical protein FWD17_00680 [Polyangiaceae bacterium]|nr:hypothetical protein [Polyangiaceae bacterium]
MVDPALNETTARPRVGPRTLLLFQLGAQYFYLSCLELFDPRQSLSAAAWAYGSILLLQTAYVAARSGERLRPLTMIATANTVLLFFTATDWLICVPVAIGWATRTFYVSRDGRPLANAGTFGVFCGGLLTAWTPLLPLKAVSHGFTTIPHFQLVVAVIGAALAVLGNHVALVVALLVGFTATRGFPNAAELIIFLHAAPDPSTSPRVTWQRWVFGVCGGALTGIFFWVNGHGNELTKVSGLVAMSFIMPWIRALGRAHVVRSVTEPRGRFGAGATVLGAALVVAYGALADRFMGYKPFDLWTHFEDARTHVRLDDGAVRELFAGNVHIAYPGTHGVDEEIVWSPLNHGWDLVRHTRRAADPLTDVATLRIAYRLACLPDAPTGDRDLVLPRLERLPKRGAWTVKETAELVLEIDTDAIRARCEAARDR